METGKLRNGKIEIGIVEYTLSELAELGGVWIAGRLQTSDDNHKKLALAADDLYLDDRAIEITGETHDDESLTFRPR